MKMWKLTRDICPELGSLLTKFRLMKLICLGYFDRTRYRLSRCSSTVQNSMSQEYETAQPCDLSWPSETVQFIAQKIEISERPATCWILGPALILSLVQEERNGTSESLCKCESTGPVYRWTISLQTKRLQKSSRKGWPIFHLPAIWTMWLRTSDCKKPGLKKHVPVFRKGCLCGAALCYQQGALSMFSSLVTEIGMKPCAHLGVSKNGGCPKSVNLPLLSRFLVGKTHCTWSHSLVLLNSHVFHFNKMPKTSETSAHWTPHNSRVYQPLCLVAGFPPLLAARNLGPLSLPCRGESPHPIALALQALAIALAPCFACWADVTYSVPQGGRDSQGIDHGPMGIHPIRSQLGDWSFPRFGLLNRPQYWKRVVWSIRCHSRLGPS